MGYHTIGKTFKFRIGLLLADDYQAGRIAPDDRKTPPSSLGKLKRARSRRIVEPEVIKRKWRTRLRGSSERRQLCMPPKPFSQSAPDNQSSITRPIVAFDCHRIYLFTSSGMCSPKLQTLGNCSRMMCMAALEIRSKGLQHRHPRLQYRTP